MALHSLHVLDKPPGVLEPHLHLRKLSVMGGSESWWADTQGSQGCLRASLPWSPPLHTPWQSASVSPGHWHTHSVLEPAEDRVPNRCGQSCSL